MWGKQDKLGDDLNGKLAMHTGKNNREMGDWGGNMSSWLARKKIQSGLEMGTLLWRKCRKAFNLQAVLGDPHSFDTHPSIRHLKSLRKHGRHLMAWRDGRVR